MEDSEVEVMSGRRNESIFRASVCLSIMNSKRKISTRSRRISEAGALDVCSEIEVKFEWARFLFKVGCSIQDYIKRSVVNGSAEITYNSFRSLEAVE